MKKITKFIQRKNLLYKTGVEYGDYTINHIQGCSHGCKYPCYAFMLAKRFGKVKTYEEWLEPAVVENAMELLGVEIPKLKKDIQSVQLCFSTDPFMYGYSEIADLSLRIIRMLNTNGIKCTVLTKGILTRRLSKLSKDNEYGITLVSLDENFRKTYEPNSAPLKARIAALRFLHEAGCKTWVSIEPYPTPNICEQNLNMILRKIKFVDKIIFGRWNYNKKVTEYPNCKEFFNKCAEDVIKFCDKYCINYHIKEGTITETSAFGRFPSEEHKGSRVAEA